MDATDVARTLVRAAPDALYISALGTATSALRAASNDGPHLYLGGAMGCALAVALGVADRCTDRVVVAVLGDGELLMGAGSLWSLAGLAPANLLVVVLRDGRYAITGGQSLVDNSSLATIAAAFPALEAVGAETVDQLADAVAQLGRPGLVEAWIGDARWPGPTPFVEPSIVRARFGEAARAGRDLGGWDRSSRPTAGAHERPTIG